MSSEESLENQLHFVLCVITKYKKIDYKCSDFKAAHMG